MNNVVIEQLDPIKIPLVKRFYKEHYPSGKANKSELIFTIVEESIIRGVVRFRSIENYRLLTGMAINTALRNKGLGHQLMYYCANEVLNSYDYCFAYSHLEKFYSQHGFTRIEAEDLPSSLYSLYSRYTNSGKDLIPMHFHINC